MEDAGEVPIAVAPSGSAINGTLDETRLERSSTSRDRAQSSANGLEESPVRSSRSFRDIMKALPPTPSKVEEKSDLGNDDTRQSEDADVFTEPRPSASTRPPTWDYHTGFDYKPKVKVGPRPSQEAGSTAQASNHYRPVSSLPAGVQMPKRKLIPSRTDSQTLYAPSRHTVSSQGSTVIAPPPTPNSNFRIPERPSTSQSNKTIIRSSPSEMKQNGMTPEKRRLMKAVQIRQRQLAARAAAIENSTPSTSEVLCNNSTFLETENETRRPKTEIYSPTKQAACEGGASDKLTDMREAERKDRCPTEADFANPEASPVSFHDISDGVSTKPSSLSSEDDSETPKKQEVPSVLSERRDGPADAMSDLHAQQLRDAPTNDPTEAMITIDPEKLAIEEQIPRKEISSGPNLAMVEETLAPLDIKETVTVIRDEPIDAAAPDQIPLPPIDEKEIMELERRPLTIGISADDNEQSILTRPSTGATRPSTADTNGLRSGEQPGKRKAPESLKRVSSPDHSEDHFLSDDSFLEELKSATVQEAKPISVSKSPITPVFPRSLSDSREDTIRSFSMPQAYHEGSANAMPVPEIPRLLSPRSASASHSHTNNLPQATPSLKKVGVSSGISQRIKALEKLSSRPTSPGTQTSPAATPASATAFPALSSRKTSLRSRPSTSETGQTLSSPVVEKLFVVPQGSRPTDGRSNPASAPLRPEPVNIKPALDTDRASNYLTPNEQQSSDQPSPPTIFKKPAIKRHTTSPSVSSNSVANQRRSDSVPTSKRDSIISRLSSSANISRRGSEAEIPRSPSESSLLSGVTSLGGEDGRDGEKKESRKSRLLKRMSNLSAVSRKSIVSALSPPVKEGPILEHVEPTPDHTKLDKPQSVELGDVNIQFPDSLVSHLFMDLFLTPLLIFTVHSSGGVDTRRLMGAET